MRRRILFACCGLASVLVHAALVSLNYFQPARPVTPPPQPPMYFEIVVEPRTVAQPDPEPEPEPPPPEPPPEPEPEPEPLPLPEPTPAPEPPPKPPPEPAPEPVVAPKEEPPPEKAPPSEVSIVVTTESQVQEEEAYWKAVAARLAAGLRYPRSSTRPPAARMVVELTIGSDGSILQRHLVDEAGPAALKAAVYRAVDQAQPLPAPPPHLDTPVDVRLPIRFERR